MYTYAYYIHDIHCIYIYIERLGGKYITCREGQGMAEWVNKEGENNNSSAQQYHRIHRIYINVNI